MQLPWLQITPDSTNQGINNLSESLQNAARLKQQRDQADAELLLRGREVTAKEDADKRDQARLDEQVRHQREQEQQAAAHAAGEEHLKIRDLHAKDPRLAASYVSQIGAKNVALEPIYGDGDAASAAAPGAAPQAATPAPPAPGGASSPIEPPPFVPSQAPQMPGPSAPAGKSVTFWNPDTRSYDTRGDGNSLEDQVVREKLAGGASPLDIRMPSIEGRAQGDEALPMSDSAQAGAGTGDQAPAAAPPKPRGPLIGYKLRYTLGNGPETVLDPLETKQIHDAQERDTIGKLDAAGLPQKYKMIIAARIAQGDKEPWQGINEAMKADDERTFKAKQQHDYDMTADQKYRVGMSNAASRAAGVKSTTERTTLADAHPVIAEMEKALKPVTDKGGLREKIAESDRTIDSLKKNPTNATVWTNAVDGAIRTATGRAAILSQYKLYTSKASGTDDELKQWAAQFSGRGLSDAKKASIYGAILQSNSELRGSAKEHYDNFRRYDNDPAVARNPIVKEAYQRLERDTFGTMPGYQKPKPQMDPRQRAQKITAMPAADQQAVKWAQDPANAGTPQAKRILALHGL